MTLCSYCGKPAVHMDHIVSKGMRTQIAADGSLRYPGWDDVTVPACFACNMRKGTRRLVPMDYEPFDQLPGTRPWMRWDGGEVVSGVLR